MVFTTMALASMAIHPGKAQAASPADAVVAAHADCMRLQPGERLLTRYLWLGAIPAARRAVFLKVLSFHVNSLSRESEVYVPRLVTNDLVAVNYLAYAWNPAIWERLATVDPYFHQKVKLPADSIVKTVWPGGKALDGKSYKANKYNEKLKAGTVIDAAAPWLPANEINQLREFTLSEAPVLRADWFINQTAIPTDRIAGYYDWLGLGKKEADFQKLIGANVEESRRVKREVAAALARSGVTLQNRGIVRFQSLTGGYWTTQDFKTSIKRQNVIRLLDQDREPPQGDASEQYGFLPNGLFAYWLQNKDGDRQDFAPDFIASDHQTRGNDRRIHAGKSCIACHVEGLRPVDDYIRKLYRDTITLTEPDYKKFLRLRQLYLSDLDRWLKRDNEDYAQALWVVSGMKPAEMARAYNRVWDDYAETDLLPADAANELGVSERQLYDSLWGYLKTTGTLDPILASFLQDPPLPIRREHWEEVYGVAQTTLRGFKP